MAWTSWQQPEGFQLEHIIYEKKHHTELGGGIARITFNRPQVLNAFNGQTQREFKQAFENAWQDVSIAAIILTGAGGNFGSGGDVQWEASSTEFSDRLRGQAVSQEGQQEGTMNELVRRCPKPVIAQVAGYSIGGSNHLAYTCDITIAADNAIFGHNGARVGSPHHGWTVAIAALTMGMKRAKEMHFFLPRYTAQEACQLGLVNKVVPMDKLEEEVDLWCERLLAVSPTCVQLRKASFNAMMEMIMAYTGPPGTLLNKMAPDFLTSQERKECTQAFLEKRIPAPYKKYIAEHDKVGSIG